MKHSKKKKNDKRWQGGFTLAELLVALGILSILLSIGMVSVTYYQRNLKVTEMDAIAKEIFVSAQNHITASKATVEWEELENQHQSDFERYFGNRIKTKPSDYPSKETWPEGGNGNEHDYHYIVYDGREDTLNSTILDIMLPYGAIDDEVRTNGHYVIEYDYKTATVYGVFYTDNSKKFSYENDIMGSSGLNNQYGRENSARGRETRKNYKNDSGHIIIGYYGGATTTELKSAKLQPLEVEVKNGDTLGVTIRDKNYGNIIEGTKVKTKISFTVTGEESQAVKKTILEINPLGNVQSGENWWTAKEEKNIGVYEVTLDDITKQDGHFADIFPEFIAGENLLIEVEAFSNEVLCTPVKTQVVTNSLFEAKYGDEENGTSFAKVSIGNIRHLQNLSPEVSNLFVDDLQGQNGKTVGRIVKVAEQIKSLDWEDFMKEKPNEEKKIYPYHKIAIQHKVLATNQFYGIENTALMEYEGNGHTLSHFSLKENANGNVGLFSQIGTENKKQEMTIKNLVLDSFTSESKTYGGNAGTLVGEVGENGDLLIQDIKSFDSTAKTKGQGNTGLFVGEVTEKGTLTAEDIFGINATVIAKNQGNAGGLVGKMSAGTLLRCGLYLADDEEESANPKSALEKYELGAYNQEKNTIGSQFMVLSEGGVSGGLIGLVEKNSIEIEDSFVAISVITKADGNGASGGFIGRNQAQETTIKNSYVSGYTKAGNYSPFYGVSVIGNGGMAGGFIGENHAQTTIKNSYSTVSLYGNTAGGLIGKLEAGDQTFEDTYTTGKITGSDQNSKTGSFIGDTGGMGKISATNSYALKDSNKSLTTTVQGIQEVDYDGLIKATFSDEFKKTADSKIETYSYDGTLLEEEYPFHLVTKTGEKNSDTEKVHYGDWPLKQKMSEGGDIGVVYYEIIDNQVYYHGYFGYFSDNGTNLNYTEVMTEGKGLENGLVTAAGKYVTEDGYMILIPKGTDVSNLFMGVGRNKGQNAQNWSFSSDSLKNKSLFQLDGYDTYYFPVNEMKNWVIVEDFMYTYINIGERENKWSSNLKKYASFRLNPYFADCITPNDLTQKKYYIRSVRHFVKMSEIVSGQRSYPDAEFIQSLDVDFKNTVFTENGKEVSYTFKTIQQFLSNYTVKRYKKNNKIAGYVIKGLSVPLFGSIGGEGLNVKVKGVTLVNSHIKGEASLAETNYGFIESCVVRAEKPSNQSYSSVIVEGKAGFVGVNRKGTIKNSYFVGTVEGDTEEGIGGFVHTNGNGTIENCYANAIVKGKFSVSGFVHTNGGIIKNSFSIGAVVSQKDAFGFMASGVNDNTIVENCYSALFQLSGESIYRFGIGRGKNYTNCFWLDNAYIEGEVKLKPEGDDRVEQGTAISYEELKKKGTNPTTYKYNSDYENIDTTTTIYPFELLSTDDAYLPMSFWGDWPLKQKKETTQDVGLLYYEKIGDEVYYHGYLGDFSEKGDNPNYKEVMTKGEGLENGLVTESGKYVTEDGYLILFPKKTEWTEETEGTEQTEKENGSKLTVIVGNEKEGEEQKIPPGQRVLLEKENSFHLEGYDAYYFPCDIIKDKIIGENFTYLYINIGKKKNQGTTEFETYINFKFNPYFADCITRNDSEPEKYYVRSVRQLMEINRKVSKQTIYKNAEFIQSLDINFENINFKKLGTSEIIDQFLSSYTVKRYKDNNRTASYVIKGLNVPLFKRIGDANITATVKGVTLVNSNTNGASFAEENYGVIESCAVRAEKPSSDAYSNVTVKAEAGFVGDNKGTIRNSYFVGTVEGDSPSGFVGTNDSNTTIENCYANVIVKGKSFASGFVNTNRGTIKNSFSVGNVRSDGTSYGFIKEFDSGRMENCYSALFHLSGQKIYPFGSGNNYINCSWLDNTYKEGEIQQETIGTAISYEELMKKGTNSITYKYNSSNPNIDTTTKIYPFELSSTDDAYIPMSFWGDWGVQQ